MRVTSEKLGSLASGIRKHKRDERAARTFEEIGSTNVSIVLRLQADAPRKEIRSKGSLGSRAGSKPLFDISAVLVFEFKHLTTNRSPTYSAGVAVKWQRRF